MHTLYFNCVLLLLLSSVALAFPEVDRLLDCPKRPTKQVVLLPHRDCRKFYICDHGEKVEMQCKKGLHFNREYQVCDYPESAGCIISVNPLPGYSKRLKCYWA